MTKEEIWAVARRQSALEAGCRPEDFLAGHPVVALSRKVEGARRYLELPLSCNLISYGGNVVASVTEEWRAAVSAYIERFSPEHCFETPNLHVLNDALEEKGLRLCFMAEYFLPEPQLLRPLDCPYTLTLLEGEDLAGLDQKLWSNALTGDCPERDVLGFGAYEGEKLVGLAACSADCDTMWQIGIDVLPDHRRQGVAAALTSRLALSVLERGRVPFYCAAWSNLPSVRNAIKSGFRPAWVEMTAKPAGLVAKLNGEKP